ncbi:MAG: hemolysin family protein [Alphaproteobacteria bacterium]
MKDGGESTRPRGNGASGDNHPSDGGLWVWVCGLFGRREGPPDLRDTIEELIDQEDVTAQPVNADELVLMRNVLNLHELSVADVMVPRADIVAIDIETPLSELGKIMSAETHSRIPVYRETLDDVAGMVHIKDVLACWSTGAKTPLSDILRRVLFVAPSMPILELLLQMRVNRVHMALVVDEYGGADGLVTIEDLVEEIVGEIEDEHDEDATPVMTQRPDGSLDADARVPVEGFEEWVGSILTAEEREEDIDTLGGLVAFLAGRVPGRGEVIRHDSGIEFEIVDADPRRIRRMRICNLPNKPDSE